ncbi:MAG: hypothetical protein ABL962_18790 [Fimbriimonadaceae bacterium]
MKPISPSKLFLIVICASLAMIGVYVGAVLPQKSRAAAASDQGLVTFMSEIVVEHPEFLSYAKSQDDKVWENPEGATIVAEWIQERWLESRDGLTQTQILAVSKRVSKMMSDLVVERDFDSEAKPRKV